MISRVNHEQDHANLWKQPGKWPGSLKIEWVYIKDIPNTQFIHIENPLNENKPACQGRDCQEVYPKTGERMMAIFSNFRSTTRLYDDFKYYDDQEKFREQKVTQKEKFSFRSEKSEKKVQKAPDRPIPSEVAPKKEGILERFFQSGVDQGQKDELPFKRHQDYVG